MSVGYTKIALPGLSGYDFSSIVDTMVQNYSLPLNQMQKKQSTLEIKKDAWRDINTRLSALKNSLDRLRNSTTWSATTASSSNTDILNVSSSAGTVHGSYKIIVDRIAVAQTAVSSVQNVENPSAATGVGSGTFSIAVGEKTTHIKVEAGSSLDKIAETINNANADVSASVIKVNGGYQLALISKNTGTENAAAFNEVEGNVLHSLGVLKADDGSGEDILNVSQYAEDARLSVNGIANIISSSNKVTSAIPGMTLDLQSADPDTPVTVKVSASFKEAEAAVKAFVDQYNSVMSFIENKVKYDADTKVKGDLFGDPALQGIQSRLRRILGSRLNNPTEPFNTLAEVGISTSSDGFGKSAVLDFDTAKFKEALEENANSVANLFGARAGGVNPVDKSSDNQEAQGLSNILIEYLHPMVMYNGSLDETRKNYEEQINKVKKEIEAFNVRLEAYAERIRLQFATLETQLAALDSESRWLTNQINALRYSYYDHD